MKKTTLFLLASLAIFSPAYSQQGGRGGSGGTGDTKDDSSSNATEEDNALQRFWEVKLGAGSFVTAIDKIVSISKSQYLLDGNFIVNEVTVDSGGRSLARFYHIVPVGSGNSNSAIAANTAARTQALLEKGAEKLGTDVQNMAQKNYPTTTHAGMIEFRVMDLKDLEAIYRSVQGAWQSGRGKKLTIK